MKVIGLRISNYGGVSAFEARFDGQHGLIRGGNEAGKTSVLNALIWAFGGKPLDGVGEPMMTGARETEVVAETDTHRVTRVQKQGAAARLVVEALNGEKVAKPQTFLDSLVACGVAFRPLDFCRMSAEKQRNALLAATGAEPELEALAAREKAAYDERRDFNRRLAEVHAQNQALALPADAPTEPVSVEGLTTKLAELQGQRERWHEWSFQGRTGNSKLEAARQKVEALQAELRQATLEQQRLTEQVATHQKSEPQKPADNADAEIRTQLKGAEAHNAAVRQRRQKGELTALFTRVQGEVDKREAVLLEVEAQRKLVLKRAEVIPGLTVTDKEVLVDGRPLGALNHQQMIELGIAVANKQQNPLRTVLIDGIESLDEAHWQNLVAQVEAAGLQLIATQVAQDGSALSFEIIPVAEGGAE